MAELDTSSFTFTTRKKNLEKDLMFQLMTLASTKAQDTDWQIRFNFKTWDVELQIEEGGEDWYIFLLDPEKTEPGFRFKITTQFEVVK